MKKYHLHSSVVLLRCDIKNHEIGIIVLCPINCYIARNGKLQ